MKGGKLFKHDRNGGDLLRKEMESDALYDVIEQNPIPASAIALWYALLHINKKAGWKEEFTVTGPALRLKAGLSSSSFKRARATLVASGYIEHQTRGNLPSAYRMK